MLSARNQFKGTIESIVPGNVMAEVVVKVDTKTRVVSMISLRSAKDMKLAVGDPVTVIIKSTSVMIGKD